MSVFLLLAPKNHVKENSSQQKDYRPGVKGPACGRSTSKGQATRLVFPFHCAPVSDNKKKKNVFFLTEKSEDKNQTKPNQTKKIGGLKSAFYFVTLNRAFRPSDAAFITIPVEKGFQGTPSPSRYVARHPLNGLCG